MRLVPEARPVTIQSVRYGERWFPVLHRHTDTSLLLYLAWGHDANFAPVLRIRSEDDGRSWGEPTENVPRGGRVHSFDDGELFELDEVGVQDPNAPETAVHYGAWSYPGRMHDVVRYGFVRVHNPSRKPTPLSRMFSGYPTCHWWRLWNTLWGRDDMTADQIQISGAAFTQALPLDDGRLLAMAYGPDRHSDAGRSSVWTMESRDRGRTWEETGVAASGEAMGKEPNETTLVRLKDHRLYAVMRVDGGPIGTGFHHMWSSDDGRTWTTPEPMHLVDEDHRPGVAWPRAVVLDDGELVMVYGRPVRNLIFDPSGTGTQWQGRLDLTAFEKETQALLGVPEEQRIRRPGGNREWDSSDYLGMVTDGPRGLIVIYDAQQYVEDWNAKPASAVRMLRVRLED